jgi:hypothetical protein
MVTSRLLPVIIVVVVTVTVLLTVRHSGPNVDLNSACGVLSGSDQSPSGGDGGGGGSGGKKEKGKKQRGGPAVRRLGMKLDYRIDRQCRGCQRITS